MILWKEITETLSTPPGFPFIKTAVLVGVGAGEQ